jgi:hypothetical protein
MYTVKSSLGKAQVFSYEGSIEIYQLGSMFYKRLEKRKRRNYIEMKF